jgi:hypothetical protein
MLAVTLRGKAVSDCEIYTPTGVLAGTGDITLVTADGGELVEPFTVAGARWYPLDGEAPSQRSLTRLEPDDMLVVVTPAPDLFVHLTKYAIALEVGPYRVLGSLSTHPGFDPEKSISRPGGSFIPLSDVTIELLDHPEAGTAERAHVHVNRYAVVRVTSPIMLGHFFPGAQLETQQVPVPA